MADDIVKKKKKRRKRRAVKKTIAPSVPTTVSPVATSVEKEEIPATVLHNALLYIEDIMDRCLIPFALGGDVGEALYDNTYLLRGEEIEILVLKKNFSEYAARTLPGLVSHFQTTDYGFLLFYEGVPIKIFILEGSYPYLDNPDFRHYYQSTFPIPNPWADYKKS